MLVLEKENKVMNIIVLSGSYRYIDKIETTIKSLLYHNKNID